MEFGQFQAVFGNLTGEDARQIVARAYPPALGRRLRLLELR